MKRLIFILSFLYLFIYYSSAEIPTIVKCQYWIDDNLKEIVSDNVEADSEIECEKVLDVRNIPEGIHRLNYRIADDYGNWSCLYSWIFYVTYIPQNTETLTTDVEYWFDEQYTERHQTAINAEKALFVVNTLSLLEGLHTLNYRVKDNEGRYSAVYSCLFYKPSSQEGRGDVSGCEYWYDGRYSERMYVAVDSASVSFIADASSLTEGIHTLNYRLKDKWGAFSAVQTFVVYRQSIIADSSYIATFEYWIDGNYDERTKLDVEMNNISFNYDTSSLSEGPHLINYMLKDSEGFYSSVHHWLFYKATHNGIKWYKYWWNNQFDKGIQVQLADSPKDYVFEELLSVPDYAKTDGYSNNSTARFHILFCDDSGNVSNVEWVDITYPDVIPPVSVIEVDKEQANESVVLKWHVINDQVDNYNIYYSEDDQPFVLWLSNTTQETAIFKGVSGVTYRFIVTARDKAGNRELLDETKSVTVTFGNQHN